MPEHFSFNNFFLHELHFLSFIQLISIFLNRIFFYFLRTFEFVAMENPLLHPFVFLYQLMQWFLDKLLSPEPPKPGAKLGRPKVAIIGAGLTGVSAASHCV